jgi:hypothetical protein
LFSLPERRIWAWDWGRRERRMRAGRNEWWRRMGGMVGSGERRDYPAEITLVVKVRSTDLEKMRVSPAWIRRE